MKEIIKCALTPSIMISVKILKEKGANQQAIEWFDGYIREQKQGLWQNGINKPVTNGA